MKLNCKLDITIEPVIFLLALSNGLSTSGQVNLILQKTCLIQTHQCPDHNCYVPGVCEHQATDLNSLKAVLRECLPVIPLLLGGFWRDKHGRNIPLFMLIIIGQIISSIICILSSVFMLTFPVLPTILLESSACGLTGALPLLIMTSACFISARTSVQDRTYRMSLVLAVYMAGATIGTTVAGLIMHNLGFITLFATSLVATCLSAIYLFCFVSEVTSPSKKSLPIWLIFSPILKKRGKHVRTIMLMMAAIHCMFGPTFLCEANFIYFFLENSLKFSVTDTGLYIAYRGVIMFFSTFLVVPVLSKYYKMEDILLGIISAAVNTLSSIWTSLSTNGLQLALCPFGDLLRGGVFAVEKSVMSKCVGPDELGQVLSAEYVLEASLQLILFPTYNFVYNTTSDKYPGAFFLITGCFSFISLILFCVTKVLLKKNANETELVEEQNDPKIDLNRKY